MPLFPESAAKAGLPPGTIAYVGRKKTSDRVAITLIEYGNGAPATETAITKLEECTCFREEGKVHWINLDGVHRTELLEDAGRIFGLHPLVLEDIANTTQRPKFEDMDDYIFVTLKMLSMDEGEIAEEQVSFVLGKQYLLSFQESDDRDVFDGIRERIRQGKGKLGKTGPDYLLYGLMDSIVDNYFVVLEAMGEEVEDLEERLLGQPGPKDLEDIHLLKRKAIHLRKYVWPLREVLAHLGKGETDLVHPEALPYLRDLYDHTISVMDSIETMRDILAGLTDIYLSNISLKLNEVMKVLTMIATIFIPLSFVAGVYGMNFENMPELKWPYGYFAVLGLMATMAVTMLLYFRRKRWL